MPIMKALGCFVLSAVFAGVHLAPVEKEEVIVAKKAGKFRGYRAQYDGKPLNVFKGIKFGKDPVGELRFRRPQPYTVPDDEVHNATEYGKQCVQFIILNSGKPKDDFHGEGEDCLYLNIWAPADQKESKKRAVMFWIHGGAFAVGTASGDMYQGAYIAAIGDVVVVNVNYRLGPLGFLYGGGVDEPGNLGLFDQLLALEWVRDNIEAFGGDSKQVTIFGESAGSMSVSAHIISPLSKGLFQRAISQSGTFYGATFSSNPTFFINQTLTTAKQFGCLKNETEITRELMDCLKNVDVNFFKLLGAKLYNPFLVYETGLENEFLPKNPVEAVKEGDFNADLDFVFGNVDDEGASFLIGKYPDDFSPVMHKTMTLSKAQNFIKEFIKKYGKPEMAEEAALFYTKNATSEDDFLEAASHAFGDSMMVCPTVLFGQKLALAKKGKLVKPEKEKLVETKGNLKNKKGNFYSYRFMRLNRLPGAQCVGWTGVCHGDDIKTTIGWPFFNYPPNYNYTEVDKEFSFQFITAWTTFAKTGKMPAMNGLEWSSALDGNEQVQYLELDYGKYRMVQNRFVDTCNRFFLMRSLNN